MYTVKGLRKTFTKNKKEGMVKMKNKKYFTQLEILEDLKEAITYFSIYSYEDLIYEVFNETQYVKGRNEAKTALEQYGLFEAIGKVVMYEREAFGDIYTKLDDPVSVANMLYYVLGIDTLYSEYPELEEAYYTVLDSEVNEDNDKILLEVIDKLIAELK